MIRQVAAIALLTLRSASRSRLVLALASVLAVALLGLPLVVRGDGTPAGDARVALGYALGASVGVLGIATIWSACGLVAVEAASRRFQMTRVKPVSGLRIWMGKWLGLVALNAALLAAACAVTCAAMLIRGRVLAPSADVAGFAASRGPAVSAIEACFPPSRLLHRPVLPTPREEAEAILAADPSAPVGPERAVLLRRIEREAPHREIPIAPGEEPSWHFRLGVPPGPGRPLWLRMRFVSAGFSRARVRGVCHLRATGTTNDVAVPVDDFTVNEIEIPVPARELAGCREIELRFRYSPDSGGGSILVQPRQSLAILVPHGTFAGNLARAAVVQLAILSLLAAGGLALSALFSFPVAVFCAGGFVAAALLSAFATIDPLSEIQDALGVPATSAYLRVARSVVGGLTAATRPAIEPRPFDDLVRGVRVATPDMLRAIAWNGLALPALFAAIGTAGLARRQFDA